MDVGAICLSVHWAISKKWDVARYLDRLSVLGKELWSITLPDLLTGKFFYISMKKSKRFSPTLNLKKKLFDWT